MDRLYVYTTDIKLMVPFSLKRIRAFTDSDNSVEFSVMDNVVSDLNRVSQRTNMHLIDTGTSVVTTKGKGRVMGVGGQDGESGGICISVDNKNKEKNWVICSKEGNWLLNRIVIHQ